MTGADLRLLLERLCELDAYPRVSAGDSILFQTGWRGPMLHIPFDDTPIMPWDAGQILAALDADLEEHGLTLDISEEADFHAFRDHHVEATVEPAYGLGLSMSIACSEIVSIPAGQPRMVAKTQAALEAAIGALQRLNTTR